MKNSPSSESMLTAYIGIDTRGLTIELEGLYVC